MIDNFDLKCLYKSLCINFSSMHESSEYKAVQFDTTQANAFHEVSNVNDLLPLL